LGWYYCIFEADFKEPMTFSELITSTGIKKEHLIKVTKIPRNRFYQSMHKPHLLSLDEIERIALAIRIDKQVLIDLSLMQKNG